MAADTTLIALANTPRNRWIADVKVGLIELPDDEHVHDPETDELLGWCAGDVRDAWEMRFHERDLYGRRAYVDFDWFEVGPVYWGDWPNEDVSDGVLRYWEKPKLITSARIAETMVVVSCRHGRYRAYWNRRDRGYKVGRNYARRGMRGHRRVAKVQNVKRWLVAHQGMICWAEAW